ncbi:hypothetical protein ZIOFF_018356 [Zingiber officinale]|uniref:VQ domain-containing protein n=1 Tax=Zingiber officinale TaxID=94328 RepID=A0A8J5HCT6_ZINOF|nr:hypothetical protein ZIOFF_018356 [Zingiber officinale]
MDHSRHSNQHQQLGVNKLGKNIRKSPLHQPTYYNHRPHPTPPPPQPQPHPHHQPQQPQPQVYNISKNDFRSIVQQLTGTPSRDSTPVPAAPQPRPSSTRLQKIRPPPLAPVARPPPPPPPPPLAARPPPSFANPNPNIHHNHPAAFPRPSPSAGPSWAESPVSAYMRYLESSLLSSDTSHHPRPLLPSPGLLPSPRPPFPFPSPSPEGLHNSASLPPLTPPSAFPSLTAFLDLLSPRSPYPLLSPGFRYPTPLTPNFALSPLPQPGILGAGPSPGLQPPPSPGLWFPQSPSGFLPILSPRWRDITTLKMMMKTTAGLRNSSRDIGGIDSGVQDPSVAGIRNRFLLRKTSVLPLVSRNVNYCTTYILQLVACSSVL